MNREGREKKRTQRLFVAVDPSRAVVEGLHGVLDSLAPLAPDARWVVPEKLHLTLAFLGNVEEETIPRIEAILRDVAPRHPPLSLLAKGGGTFGRGRQPRVLWMGLEGEVEALAGLREATEEGLVSVGYVKEEREFRPHLTLARAREPRGDPGLARAAVALAAVDLGAFRVEEVALYRSVLSPKGSTYTRLAAERLGG